MNRNRTHWRLALSLSAVMVLAFAAVLTSACRGADQIAPEGATITVAGNPALIIKDASGSGSADIVATVSSAAGVPLKDQDVRFSSTAGALFTPPPDNEPAANVPIRTDDLGNAHVILVTDRNTTVTARSGKASGTLTLDAVQGNLSAILLNQDTSGASCLADLTFLSCSDSICLVAQAVDNTTTGIRGVTIVFDDGNPKNSAGQSVSGVFTVTQGTTDANGFVATVYRLGSNCQNVCTGGKTCSGDLTAATQGGTFVSSPLHFDTNIS